MGISLFGGNKRWRAQKLSPEQHTVRLPDMVSRGTYLFRIGLINEHTFSRLPVYTNEGSPIGDHINLGLFYVTQDGHDPRVPDAPVSATFEDKITLLGYSLPKCAATSSHSLCVRLHWQALRTIERDYTVFVHLLDLYGQRVAGYDSQPLGGLYPTSRWSSGEVVVSDFNLTLPEDLATGEYKLVTGFYDLASMERLSVAAEGTAIVTDNAVILRALQLPG